MKRRCAKKALELIEDGMTIGLGGGETIGYLVEYLSESSKHVSVVTPSFDTEQACVKAGLNVVPLWSVDHCNIAFDGCDEADHEMNALKSGGAIHTREKLIAAMSERYVLLIDESKYFDVMPFKHDITIELLKDSYSYVLRQIQRLNGVMKLRKSNSKAGPVISDDGHFIADVHFDHVENIRTLAFELDAIQGVIETSLFIDLVTDLIISNEKETYRIGD